MSPPRIIAGRHRGRRLEVPPGDAVRPSAERLREAVFSMLGHGEPALRDCRFLDLFAGSGAIGLEALSRGAATSCLVEADRRAAAVARRNIEKLGETARARLLVADATRLPPAGEPYAIAYLDPPYGSGLVPACLTSLVRGGWLAADALVVVEIAAREALAPPPGFVPLDERRYGAGRIVRLRFAAAN
ncbi:MAG: 16S rRNA (guanine(966)-N(2))-methyltransferase RsmD [Geminicoccaceae bacterium]